MLVTCCLRGAGLRCPGEHPVPPHGHAHDQHDQRQGSQPDRRVHQRQFAGHRADYQQRDGRRDNGRDDTEPDHVRSPVSASLTTAFAMRLKAARAGSRVLRTPGRGQLLGV
jgi:hypothetical protein